MASALDLWEHETGLHSKRVACDTLELAQRSIHDAPERLRQIYWGAVLYDIGKIGIPDAILLKEGPLTDSESAGNAHTSGKRVKNAWHAGCGGNRPEP